MPTTTICKIVRQYNKTPVSREDMLKLLEIAEDYRKVKNYVYQRYGGIGSLAKLYPGYTVQNEMTKSGLRESMGLPSVYFYLAVFDALRDIKSQWARTKAAVLKRVNQNDLLTEREKHFARYLLKVSNAFESVLNHSPLVLSKELQKQYDLLVYGTDQKKVENYLCRQVRKCYRKPHTRSADSFSLTERAYRYADHGIYISAKEKRKRIFILLTDNNHYCRQLSIRLFPQRGDIELRIPVDMAVKKHVDYTGHVGLSVGMLTMLVTDEGHKYGEDLNWYQTQLSDWLREQTIVYNRNRLANSGRKKYYARKRKMEEQLHGYINQELNRFLKAEKPKIVYFPRFSYPAAAGPIKRLNYFNTTWQRGYIRNRLAQKCREQSVELVEVFGKGISSECSQCGALGEKKDGMFICSHCGYQTELKQNAAQNAKKRGEGLEKIK